MHALRPENRAASLCDFRRVMHDVGHNRMNLEIRSLKESDRDWARAVLTERWGSARMITRGMLHQADKLPGFVALSDGTRKGLVTYRISDSECEIITLDSLQERRGLGTALLDAVRALAHEQACRRLWLVTTNDNSPAQQFYQN